METPTSIAFRYIAARISDALKSWCDGNLRRQANALNLASRFSGQARSGWGNRSQNVPDRLAYLAPIPTSSEVTEVLVDEVSAAIPRDAVVWKQVIK